MEDEVMNYVATRPTASLASLNTWYSLLKIFAFIADIIFHLTLRRKRVKLFSQISRQIYERERERERKCSESTENVGNGRSRGSCRTVKREQPKRTILDCRLARSKQILERTPPTRSNPIYRSAITHAVSDLGTINQRDKYTNRDARG
ncbi:unnamed protein product, partial [Heterotrigona itama]